MTRIVVVDDHQLVREGMIAVLCSHPDFQIVGEAGDGRTAVELVDQLHPDVLVVDLLLPGMPGLDVVREVHERFPGVRIVVVSLLSAEEYVVSALRQGAHGYVLKDAGTDTLAQAIRTVCAGRRYLCSPLSERAIEVYLSASKIETLDLYDVLSPREREILQLVAEGHTSAVVAERLFLSVRTVENYRTGIMHKMGFRHHTDLVRFALRRNLLPPDG